MSGGEYMTLEEMRKDCAVKQKKGLHFILASVLIWMIILGIHLSSEEILRKNLYTFMATSVLVPTAYLISKWIKVDFTNKSNPLTELGVLFSFNQMLYLLIAMWIYNAEPEKMVMVLAMIFGAHLLPYSWLYQSKSYFIFSIVIPFGALILGLNYPVYVLSAVMIVIEIFFSILLWLEVKKI